MQQAQQGNMRGRKRHARTQQPYLADREPLAEAHRGLRRHEATQHPSHCLLLLLGAPAFHDLLGQIHEAIIAGSVRLSCIGRGALIFPERHHENHQAKWMSSVEGDAVLYLQPTSQLLRHLLGKVVHHELVEPTVLVLLPLCERVLQNAGVLASTACVRSLRQSAIDDEQNRKRE